VRGGTLPPGPLPISVMLLYHWAGVRCSRDALFHSRSFYKIRSDWGTEVIHLLYPLDIPVNYPDCFCAWVSPQVLPNQAKGPFPPFFIVRIGARPLRSVRIAFLIGYHSPHPLGCLADLRPGLITM